MMPMPLYKYCHYCQKMYEYGFKNCFNEFSETALSHDCEEERERLKIQRLEIAKQIKNFEEKNGNN